MSALTIQEAAMHERAPHKRSPPPQAFRGYLLNGDHWRVGRRIRSENARPDENGLLPRWSGPAKYEGMRMAEAGRPMNLAPSLVDHLDQALVEVAMEPGNRTARVRYRTIEHALNDVAEDRPEEIRALRYFIVPLGRRPHDVRRQATEMEVQERTLYGMRDRAIVLLWDEIGGVWQV